MRDRDDCNELCCFRYPILASLCFKHMELSATSLPNQRAFLVTGEIVSARGKRLLPAYVVMPFFHERQLEVFLSESKHFGRNNKECECELVKFNILKNRDRRTKKGTTHLGLKHICDAYSRFLFLK